MLTPYVILGIPSDASDAEAKRAWKQFAFKHSPDRHQNSPDRAEHEEKFKQGQWAWSVLGDATKRQLWDARPTGYGEAHDAEGDDDLPPPGAAEIGDFAARLTGDRAVGDLVEDATELTFRGVRFLGRLARLLDVDGEDGREG